MAFIFYSPNILKSLPRREGLFLRRIKYTAPAPAPIKIVEKKETSIVRRLLGFSSKTPLSMAVACTVKLASVIASEVSFINGSDDLFSNLLSDVFLGKILGAKATALVLEAV